jgi:predicted nucleotidyltransferase
MRRPNQTEFNYNVTDETLEEMVRTIVREADPEQIILFGSRARGEGRPDSDVDLIVIEKEPYGRNRSRRLRAAALYQALMKFKMPKDLLLYSQAEVEYWRPSLNNVLARALREGKVLYARP